MKMWGEAMKIGCNLSNELMELLDEKKVTVDYVKIALGKSGEEIPQEYKRYGKLLLHGVGQDISQHTGTSQLQDINWQCLNSQVQFCNNRFIGVHCGTYQDDWEPKEVTYEIVKSRMDSFIKLWKEKINVELLIENVPYSQYYEMNNPRIIKHSVLPKLISELCIEHEIGLILDIAHAKVAASGLNMTLRDYLIALPLEKVKEIHAVGTKMTEVGLRDNHLEMNEEDYETLEFVLGMTNPEIVTLEYGGFGEHFAWRSNKEAIERQLNRIATLVNKRNDIL
jgi:uncharacterized protein (UPF0276 family)